VIAIADMVSGDWPTVRAIYQEGIDTGDASFDLEPPDWPEWDAGHLRAPRLVARDGDRVVGWAALSPVQRKSAYRGVAEASVYVAASARGAGVARELCERLIAESEEAGIWTLEAWIFPENRASIELCRQFGFRPVGTRERIGRRQGRWRDVLVLERRSGVVDSEADQLASGRGD
jgi:phosphinothricin acetyltransferase